MHNISAYKKLLHKVYNIIPISSLIMSAWGQTCMVIVSLSLKSNLRSAMATQNSPVKESLECT